MKICQPKISEVPLPLKCTLSLQQPHADFNLVSVYDFCEIHKTKTELIIKTEINLKTELLWRILLNKRIQSGN